MTRKFFSKKRAQAFADEMTGMGYDAKVWMDKDGFGQLVYIVKWF